MVFLLFALFLFPPGTVAAEPDNTDLVLQDFQSLYAPVAKDAGGELALIKKMESPLELASADFSEGKFEVILHGGLLKSPKMHPDLLRITLCHEIGHLFGGSPYRPAPPEWDGPTHDGDTFFSAEGQADYYSALACFRQLAANRGAAPENPPAALAKRCGQAWGNDKKATALCERAALAQLSLLQLVKEFPLSFDTPDLSVAPKTIRGEYPARQCRLDTALAAATCTEPGPLDQRSLKPGCQPPASRPACWFRD